MKDGGDDKIKVLLVDAPLDDDKTNSLEEDFTVTAMFDTW